MKRWCLLAWLLVSCRFEDSVTLVDAQRTVPSSARKIAASGEVLRLGSSSDQAAREESPGWTRFAHDYWLDTTEATQGEFESLMGRNPSPTAAMGGSKPVVNATWFDAILFCNARSKRDGLDTVYEYRSLSRDAGGSVWEIQGLASRLDRSGWRLPTEAEWEFAARAGTPTTYPWGELSDSSLALEHAWFQKNSQAALHEVARLKPNAWGIYDMAGNAMEWVQDWKGSYPKDTVVDFAGLDAPSDIPEAPLKGGAYAYGLEHLRPSSRSATYAAYHSAKAEYVGFRCARGGFTPTYTNASGQSVQAPPVSILRKDVAQLLGAQSARLVFLNRSNGKGLLSWIDYGDANPVVRNLPDVDPVFHPVISPDGQWVAWCTAMEGSTGASRIKARRLLKNDTSVFDLGEGVIPRWWVDGTDTLLVRVSSAMDNTASADWGLGATVARRWSNGGLTGPTETWSNAGSYHDGRSGSYLYTGYRRLKQFDVSGKSSRTLFTYPQNGKSVGDTSQVCNASAGPDGSGQVLFLDFGFTGKSGVVGRPYGIHEVAFLADSNGNVMKTFPVAMGKSQWGHLEWSNHPQWAVGAALEGSYYKEVDLLDLSTGSIYPVISGQELWMPGLWLGASRQSFLGMADPDSSGAWATPSANAAIEQFATKMRSFWPVRDRIKIAVIGSSRAKWGIAPEVFTFGKAFNFGYDGSEPLGDRRMLEDYVLTQLPSVKIIVLSLMPGWLFSRRGEVWGNASATFGYRYDKNHAFWKEGLPKGYLTLVASRSWGVSSDFDTLGGTQVAASGWGSNPPGIESPYSEDTLSGTFQANFADLMAIADTCKAKGIHLVLVNFPQSPFYASTPYMGRYGPTWSTWSWLKAKLLSVETTNGFFHFYDANMDGHHDYASGAAIGDNHLSTHGAVILTTRLDSLISTFSQTASTASN